MKKTIIFALFMAGLAVFIVQNKKTATSTPFQTAEEPQRVGSTNDHFVVRGNIKPLFDPSTK